MVESDTLRERWLEELRRVPADRDDNGLTLKSPQISYNDWRIAAEHGSNFRTVVLRPPQGKAPATIPPDWAPCPAADQKKHWRYRVELKPEDFQALIAQLDIPVIDHDDDARIASESSKPVKNPDWSWDEHVLALELYMENPKSPPGKESPQTVALSALLNQFGVKLGLVGNAEFRNPAGVYMKMMNFRRLDPHFQAEGKSGLSQGAKMEQRVWDRYSHDLDGLRAQAALIRTAIEDPAVILANLIDSDYEAEEGATVMRLHVSRERDPKLARRKREKVLAEKGRLACEVCDFDFGARYGSHGQGFIEVHHRIPVSKLAAGAITRLADLAVVCANCHRMLHRKNLMEIGALRGALLNQ